PQQTGARQYAGKAQRDLAGAAAGIEDDGLGRQAVALKQRLLLRPDRVSLRCEIADHRLVRHFLCLWIEIVCHSAHADFLPCVRGRFFSRTYREIPLPINAMKMIPATTSWTMGELIQART